MPNGSLGDLLHTTKGAKLLDWSMRYKIAVGAAQVCKGKRMQLLVFLGVVNNALNLRNRSLAPIALTKQTEKCSTPIIFAYAEGKREQESYKNLEK
jgi:hypothetical protein